MQRFNFLFLIVGGAIVGGSLNLHAEFTKQVLGRGPHHRRVQAVWQYTNEVGEVVSQTNQWTEFANGLHYRENGEWRESQALVEQHPDGAVAVKGRHQAIFSTDLNSEGAIDMLASDDQRLLFHPLALRWANAATGERTIFAVIQSSIGEILPPNQVIYRDCFDGVEADFVYTYTPAFLESDVVLLENPDLPAGYDGERADPVMAYDGYYDYTYLVCLGPSNNTWFLDIHVSSTDNTVIRNICQPQAVVHPTSGNIYMVYPDKGEQTGDQGDVYMRYSTDRGDSWSSPIRINDDSGDHDQWCPSIAMKPDGSELFVGFYDRRCNSTNTLIHTFGRIGAPSASGITFDPNFQISDSSFFHESDNGKTPMTDYDMAAADSQYFYYCWTDQRHPYYFNIPEYYRNEMDIRFVKVN